MDFYKDNILDGMIFTFHFQRFSAAAAHLMLTQMIGSDICTLQYVESLYQRIENKKFSLKKPQLLDLPQLFLGNVVKTLDVESRSIVRKSCKTLRAIVDCTPLHLEYLTIHFDRDPNSTFLYFADLAVKYYKNEEGCIVKRSYGREQFVKGKTEQLVLADLKSVLINKNLEIGSLILNDQRTTPFFCFDEFIPMVSSLGHKLHVKHFEWTVSYHTEQLRKIFNSMKPSILNSIESNIRNSRFFNYIHTLDERIFNLPQWKGAKKLDHKCMIGSSDYIHLAQFDKVALTAVNPDRGRGTAAAIIMEMKNELLKNENLDQIFIWEGAQNHPLLPVGELKPLLLPFQSPTDHRWAQFDYPNSDKKLLLRVCPRHIWFKGPCYERDVNHECNDEIEDEELGVEEG